MDHGVFRAFKRELSRLGAYRLPGKQVYSDGVILAVYFFAVLSRRPVVWACDPADWPPGLLRDAPGGRRGRGGLPSQSVMSRRLRRSSLIAPRDRVELRVRPDTPGFTLAAAVDARRRRPHAAQPQQHLAKSRVIRLVARHHTLPTARGADLAADLLGSRWPSRSTASRRVRSRPSTLRRAEDQDLLQALRCYEYASFPLSVT